MVGQVPIREVSTPTPGSVRFSFCTLVTRIDEYRAMVNAFVARGFTGSDCEFLYVDNSVNNRYDAFAAYNRFLLEARGTYVVLCHQDILPRDKGRVELDAALADLSRLDPHWGLCGNAGGTSDGAFAIHIAHPGEEIDLGGDRPTRVCSLDENFLLVRRDANLALSRDLSGFHWYGSDLCIVADVLGWNAYVIDFSVLHQSRGNIKGDFKERGHAFRRKYAHAFRPRWQWVVTKQPVYLSSSPIRTFIYRAIQSLKVRSAVFWREKLGRQGPVSLTSSQHR